MEKLRINRKDIYTIEVNDKGDTIEFDLGDIELPYKFQRAADKVRSIQNKLKGKIAIIEKQQDKKDKNHILSKNEDAMLKVWKECFSEMRSAMDEFLGAGGCDKIFGETNYIDMFNDLFDAFNSKDENGLSHLDKMKISREGMIDRIKQKYSAKGNNAI